MPKPLPHEQTLTQGSGSTLVGSERPQDASPSVLFRGTTPARAESLGNPAGPLPPLISIRLVPPDPPAPEARAGGMTVKERVAELVKLPPREPPDWAHDRTWTADMEHVWRVRVAEDVADYTARAKRLRRHARDVISVDAYGGHLARCRAPGVRDAATTRRQLRGIVTDERTIIVMGEHGAMTRAGRRVELWKSAEWCENRARSMAMTREALVTTCRSRWRTVACGCKRTELLVGCDQPMLCAWCRAKHWRAWRKRIARSMKAHLRTAVDAWIRGGRKGSKPGVYLITLTMPHSGDLVTDRRVIGEAWGAISKAASYGGYYVGDTKSEAKWWGHHAVVYEVTGGKKDDGHLHAHAAVISQWVPYNELRAAWSEACPGAKYLHVVDPATQAQRSKAFGRKANTASNAAGYLAKYVTKGVEPRELTGQKAGEMLVAFRGRRKVTTSRYFWRPLAGRSKRCECCNEFHTLVEAPDGLQHVAPAAVLASMQERSKWKPARGSPLQVLLSRR